MANKLTYRLWAWGVLIAFCMMMAVKQFHHHEPHHTHQHICVLDHLPLEECRHAHSSVCTLDNDEDDCAICHFSIAKLFQPKFFFLSFVISLSGLIREAEYRFTSGIFYSSCLGRAPPVC